LQGCDQDTGSDEGDDNAAPEVKGALDVKEACQVAANDGAYEADNDIPDTTVASPAYSSAGKEPGN
jgi:hypothetical protein